jgi:hypothetical protein
MPNDYSSDKFSKPLWRKSKRDGEAIEIHSGFQLVATVPHPDRHEPNEERDANADLICAAQRLLYALSIAKCRLEQSTVRLELSKDSVSKSLAGFIRADLVGVRSALNLATGGRAESRNPGCSGFTEDHAIEESERENARLREENDRFRNGLEHIRGSCPGRPAEVANVVLMNIGIGTRVVMPEPHETDSYSIGGFVGTVIDSLENGNLIVEDADAVFHEIEAARIVELAASEETEQSTGVRI